MRTSIRFRVAGIAAVFAMLGGTAVSTPAAPGVSLPSTTLRPDPAGILDGKKIKGFVLGDRGARPELMLQDLPRLKMLGVNTVALYIYVDATAMNANHVSKSRDTYLDAELGLLTDAIHRQKLAVMWVPYIVMRKIPGGWHGNLAPSNPDAFFQDYRNMLNRYAALAEKYKVEIYSVGTELSTLQNANHTGRWATTVNAVRQRFKGIVTYIATAITIEYVTWWNLVDYIGITPYVSLSAPPPNGPPVPTVPQLKSVWQSTYFPKFAATAAKFGKPVFYGEIGYGSIQYATAKPATGFRYNLKPSQKAQRNAYKALLEAAGNQWWYRGTVWWRWDPPERSTRLSGTFSPRDKLAECELFYQWGPKGNRAGQALKQPPHCNGFVRRG